MRTGKGRSEGQAFHRRLLSEYNTEFTLVNYISYFELKSIAKNLECLKKSIYKRKEQERKMSLSTSVLQESTTTVAMNTEDSGSEFLLTDAILHQHELEKAFFNGLRDSFEKVKRYLHYLEEDLKLRVKELNQLKEEEIRARPEIYIPKLYVKVQAVLRYRALNLAAFRKIMEKFRERCAFDSLELQQRLMDADRIIHNSEISKSRIDLRRIALDLIALYGTVYRLTYEDTVAHLSRYEHLAGVNIRRILPHSETFFFTLNFPFEERQGDFAMRIIPGRTSLFCEKMICEVLQCSRFPPCCSQLPDGEINVVLKQSVRGDDVFVLQSLVKCDHLGLSHSATLMELVLMLHTAKLSFAGRVTAVIPYLAYTPSVSSIAVVAELLEAMGCQHVITVDMAIEQVEGLFSVPLENISARYEFVRFIANQLTSEGNDFRNITVVAPTGKSVGRAKNFADALMNYKKFSSNEQFVPVCTVVYRQVPTQEIQTATPSAANNSVAFSNNDAAASDVLVETNPGQLNRPDSLCVNSLRLASRDYSAANRQQGQQQQQQQQEQQNEEKLLRPFASSILEKNTNVLDGHMKNTYAFEQALHMQEEGIQAIRINSDDNPNTTDCVVLAGDVKGRLCIIVDTVIDEAIKICRTARKLREEGASRIILIATHFIPSGGALERLVNSPIDLIVVTDSVNQDAVFVDPLIAHKLRVLPIAPLLARAIEKMHTENSLATLFES